MCHAMVLLVLGAALLGLGLGYGGYGWLATWLGASFVINGLGHVAIGAGIYGKGQQGKLPLWAKALHLPFLLLTWAVWHVQRRVSREHAFDKVTDSLIIGRRLLANERPPNIRHWVDLTAEFDEPKAIREAPGYLCLPILDGGTPAAQALNEALDNVGEGLVYVHCAQGHGRTALFAACLLLRQGLAHNADDAMDLLRTARSGVRLNATQQRFLRTGNRGMD